VEDEKPLLKLISDVLRSYGYKVFEANSAMEALKTFSSRLDEIDLLFTDMKTPEGLSGLQLAEKLLEKKPALKVIYTTGYSLDLAQTKVPLEVGINFLPKPYQPPQLLYALRKAFDFPPPEIQTSFLRSETVKPGA
jgi:CheY-like chemotaxis protein